MKSMLAIILILPTLFILNGCIDKNIEPANNQETTPLERGDEIHRQDEINYTVDLQKCITLTTPADLEYYKSRQGSSGEEYRYDAFGRGIHCPYPPLSSKQYVLFSAEPSLCPDSYPFLGETLIGSLTGEAKPASRGYYGKNLSRATAFYYYNEADASGLVDWVQYSCFSRDSLHDTRKTSPKSVEVVCCETK